MQTRACLQENVNPEHPPSRAQRKSSPMFHHPRGFRPCPRPQFGSRKDVIKVRPLNDAVRGPQIEDLLIDTPEGLEFHLDRENAS